MVVISLIANGYQYPNSARSLLIFGLAVLNICGYIFIREIAKRNKWINNSSILCWQQGRQLIFLIMIFVSTFIQFSQIEFVVAVVFYIISGVLVLVDISIHIKILYNGCKTNKKRTTANAAAKIAKKQRKETDKTFNKELKSLGTIGMIQPDNDEDGDGDEKNINDDEKHDDAKHHLEIAVTLSVK